MRNVGVVGIIYDVRLRLARRAPRIQRKLKYIDCTGHDL